MNSFNFLAFHLISLHLFVLAVCSASWLSRLSSRPSMHDLFVGILFAESRRVPRRPTNLDAA